MPKQDAITTDQLEKFFARFVEFENRHRNDRLEEAKAAFAQIKSGADVALADVRAQDRQMARGFNIFSVLGVGYAEVRLHSALLAELLCADGTHGQGDLFQASFINYVARALAKSGRPGLSASPTKFGKWNVVPEYTLPSGRRLDILLRNSRARSLIVIENKVWAGDQTNQIEDYLMWMEKQARYDADKRILVYLTPGGGMASSTRRHDAYVRMSYRWDITNWLTTVMPRVAAPPVRETLAQYLELLPSLY